MTARQGAAVRIGVDVLRLVASIGIGALVAVPAWASENETQHYPVGINTVATGILPPPGMVQYLDYFQIADLSGDRGSDGEVTNPNKKLTAITNAPRVLYSWKGVSIAGLHWTTGVVLPLVHLDLKVAPGLQGRDFSLADVDIQNYLSGHNATHTLFYSVGFDATLPTGHYDTDQLVSTGTNYYTFAPSVNATWIPNARVELTGTVNAEFNTTNPATHYLSGNDIDLDYGITYRPLAHSNRFGVSLQGYFFQQLGDDKIAGIKVGSDGNKGREFGIGPQLRYDIAFGGFIMKYQRLYAVENRTGGNRFWLELAIPLTKKPHDYLAPAPPG